MLLNVINDNDTILIRELTNSYTLQFGWYQELRELVQKTLGKLILSRGDISGVISGLEKKSKLLDTIEAERNRTSEYVKKWHERKKHIEAKDAEELNSVLMKIETAIKDFLNEEDQLKKYIEHLLNKGNAG